MLRAGVIRKAAVTADKAVYDEYVAHNPSTLTGSELKEQAERIEQIFQDTDDWIREEFANIEFKNDLERDAIREYDMRLIRRFVTCDAKRPHVWSKIETRDVQISDDLTVEGVTPTFMSYHRNLPIDAQTGQPVNADFCLEAAILEVKVNPDTQTETYCNLKLWALLKYLRSRVNPGQRAWLKASLYYLRKKNDSDSPTNPNFDANFFDNAGGQNIVSLEEEYQAPMPGDPPFRTENDEIFDPQVEHWQEGMEEEECSEKDCDLCSMNLFCKWKNPPLAIHKVPVIKTVDMLTLTKAQENMINVNKGVWRCIAGPGSGKTLVVSLRVVTLLNSGVLPSEIMCVTFTNAGAEEMKSRNVMYNSDIGDGSDLEDMPCTTFNAFGAKLIQDEYARFGYSQPPKVIDDVERSGIIARMLQDDANLKKYPELKNLNYRNFTMDMKNAKGALAIAKRVFQIAKMGEKGVSYNALDAEKVYEKLGGDHRFFNGGIDTVKALLRLYDLYDEKLREENLCEFADQEVLIFELLRQEPTYFNKLGLKHIIVDEFQDTSEGQIEIVKQLTKCPTFESLMVVGDDSQSIYGFRFTSPEFLVHFENYIGMPVNECDLLENFRSQKNIVDYANEKISLNTIAYQKKLIATKPAGDPVHVEGFYSREDRHNKVLEVVQDLLSKGIKPEKIAVLAKTNEEILFYQGFLGEHGIQTVNLNPEKLIDNSLVQAGISLIYAVNDDQDEQHLLYYVQGRLGGRILTASEDEVEQTIAEVRDELEVLRKLKGDEFNQMLFDMLAVIDSEEDPDEIYQGFLDTLKSKKTYRQISNYCTDFKDYGSKTAVRRMHDYEGVVLTTAHSSKGLEWDNVIVDIAAFDSRDFNPGMRSGIEEARRLEFVAATRAREELWIFGDYVSYGSVKNRHYNRFLLEDMKIAGQKFDPGTIEQQIKLRRELKKQESAKAKTDSPETSYSRSMDRIAARVSANRKAAASAKKTEKAKAEADAKADAKANAEPEQSEA